jgi:restriction system protein
LNQDESYYLFSYSKGEVFPAKLGEFPLFSVEEINNATTDIRDLYFEEPKRASNYATSSPPDLELEMIQHFQRHPEEMYSIAPRKFEELIAAIFKNHGFRVELTPPTRDGGIDIIAIEDSIITGESVHLVECKRYAREQRVGIGIVQRLLGVVTQMQATKGIIVTTSYFSADAVEAALNTKHIMTLRDYDVLVAWLRDIQPSVD